MKWTFLLDMDGVVVDILPSFLHVFVDSGHLSKERYKELIDNWPRGQWGVEDSLDMGTAEMWEIIEAVPNFWRDLPEYPYFMELYIALSKRGDVVFLTTPTWDVNCVAQKLGWLQDRLGRDFRDYILSPRKELLAGPDRILIDDREENCSAFAEAGGGYIPIPRRWNHYDDVANKVMVSYVMSVIDQFDAGLES